MKVKRVLPVKLFRLLIQVCLIFTILGSDMNSTRVSFPREITEPAVNIGLLIQDARSLAASQGAELAIHKANNEGGFKGLPFRLFVRSMEGPWGTGSKQAVELIFKNKVWALIGSHDGRNAHLVEQAATKATIVLLSAWSGDPTLSQAFIPWFFNCVPNYNQQTIVLIDEIYNKRNITNPLIVYDDEYDSQQAMKCFLKQLRPEGKTDPPAFQYNGSYKNTIDLMNRTGNAGCIILFCKPVSAVKILGQIRESGSKVPIYGSLFLINENELTRQELESYDNSIMIPSGNWNEEKKSAFIKEFSAHYGKAPGMAAAYSYDSMNLLIEAIKKAGSSEREMIQKALSESNLEGVTGTIHFDEKGNRTGSFELMSLKNGIPYP